MKRGDAGARAAHLRAAEKLTSTPLNFSYWPGDYVPARADVAAEAKPILLPREAIFCARAERFSKRESRGFRAAAD
jgi:hypothetical protein